MVFLNLFERACMHYEMKPNIIIIIFIIKLWSLNEEKEEKKFIKNMSKNRIILTYFFNLNVQSTRNSSHNLIKLSATLEKVTAVSFENSHNSLVRDTLESVKLHN